MQTRDPTAKQNLTTTACMHQRQTRNNTPGALPKITQAQPALTQPDPCQSTTEKQRSTRICGTTSPVIIIPPAQIPGGVRASARLISQQAVNAMTMQEVPAMPLSFTPRKLVPATYPAGSMPVNHGEATIDQDTQHHVTRDYHPTCANTRRGKRKCTVN